MWLTRLIRGMRYSGYDLHGDLKYLLGRTPDPTQCDMDGVPPEVRDEALAVLCDSFDIPERQMHCLRRDDELTAIYQSFVGPRFWDDMEFERLYMALGKFPGGKPSFEEFETIKTVGDVVCAVATRRAVTSRSGEPE